MNTQSWTIVRENDGTFAVMRTDVLWRLDTLSGEARISSMGVHVEERGIPSYGQAEDRLKFWYSI